MKLYNTLTRKVENFVPYNKELVTMYTCGPTVYHYAHIGNLRTYIFEDILEKSLEYVGYNVKRVMNITDVGHMTSDADSGEDKMVTGAIRENKTVWEIAEYYTEAFLNDIEILNVRKPEIVEKATDVIDTYIEIIEKLLKDGFAYIADGNVYFDISKTPEYYELADRNGDELLVAVRDTVEEDINKKNPFDFGLWFTNSKFDNQDMQWDSPWGRGYPGWHIECTGIAIKHLGNNLDIHCGGVDNIFPHHTNEIAQSESYLGHKWCNYWLHGEHLNIDSGKMSKSSGEFLTISLLMEKGYTPIVYRYYCLQSHYRNQLAFSFDSLDTATNGYNRLLNRISKLKENVTGNIIIEDFEKYNEVFKNALKNDLNTSLALTTLYDVIKDEKLNNATKLALIFEFDKVLTLNLLEDNTVELTDDQIDYIESEIAKRNVAKENKDYQLADKIRNDLKTKGIEIKDSPEGTIYEVSNKELL